MGADEAECGYRRAIRRRCGLHAWAVGFFVIACSALCGAAHAPLFPSPAARALRVAEQLPTQPVTALHRAAQNGQVGQIYRLIQAGANVNARATGGETPLFLAVQSQQVAAASVLLEAGADCAAANDAGETALHFAAAAGHAQLVSLLLAYGAPTDAVDNASGAAPLFFAVGTAGRLPVVRWLVNHGAEVNRSSKGGVTALHVAATVGDADVVRFLIAHGANPNATTSDGYSALILAAFTEHFDVASLLVEHGSDVNIQGHSDHVTALSLAASKGDLALVKLLIHGGADVNTRMEDGQTPLTAALAARHIEIAEVLIQAGAHASFESEPTAATLVELVHARSSGDTKRLEQVVLRTGYLAVILAAMYADEALNNRARGEGDATLLERARAIAAVQFKATDNDGLSRLINRYDGMTATELAQRQLALAGLAQAGDAFQSGKLDEAQHLTETALEQFDKLDDTPSRVRACVLLAQLYAKAGRRDAADLYLRKTNYLLSQLGVEERDPEYFILGKYTDSAASAAKGGLTDAERFGYVVEELDPPPDLTETPHGTGGAARSARATALASEGRYSEASLEYRQLLDSPATLTDSERAHALLGAARVARALWQPSRAEYLFESALHEFLRLGEKQAALATRIELADMDLQLGRMEEAADGYVRASRGASELGTDFRSVVINARLGDFFSSEGDLARALEYYELALRDAHSMSPGGRDETAVLMNIGTVYARAARWSEALHYYEPVLSAAQNKHDMALEAGVRVDIALALHGAGRDAEAWGYIEALGAKPIQSADAQLAWRFDRAGALVLQGQARPENAVVWYGRAVLQLEQINAHSMELDPAARSHGFDRRRFVYREYVDLLARLAGAHPEGRYETQLFELSEQVKSRIFTEMVALSTATRSALNPAKSLNADQGRRLRLVRLRQELLESLQQPPETRDEKQIESLRAELQSEEAAQVTPAVGESGIAIELKSITQIQGILRGGEVVVSYVLGVRTASALVLTKDHVRFVALPTDPAELQGLVDRFRSGLERVADWQDLERFDPVLAYELYKKILEPVARDLAKDSRVFICGDEQIYSVPMEALVDQPVTAEAFAVARSRSRNNSSDYLSEYAELHYVIDTFAIRYLPSVTVLALLRTRQTGSLPKWKRPLVAFGDPIFPEPSLAPVAAAASEVVIKPGDTLKFSSVAKDSIAIADYDSLKDLFGALFKGSTLQLVRGDKTLIDDIQGSEIFNRMSWTPDVESQFFPNALARATGRHTLASLPDTNEEVRLVAKEVGAGEGDLFLRERASKANLFGLDLRGTRYLLFATHGFLGGEFSGVAEPALALSQVGSSATADGFLTMSEIAALNLDAELVVLSACETAGFDRKATTGDGFAGLTRSFMGAGAESLIVSHWSVDSRTARDLVTEFFKLKISSTSAEALRRAKLDIRRRTRDTGARAGGLAISQSHPFFWAPFVFVGDDTNATRREAARSR